MIPDPRRSKKKDSEGRAPFAPQPLEPGALPEEPENVRSPERPAPKRKPPTNWAGKDDEKD